MVVDLEKYTLGKYPWLLDFSIAFPGKCFGADK